MKKLFDSPLKFKFTSIIISSFIFSLANSALAQISPVERQDQLMRDQQNIIEQQDRQREFEKIEQERDELKKKEEKKEEPIPLPKPAPIKKKPEPKKEVKLPSCFDIKTVELVGANSISKKKKDKLTSIYIGKCFDNLSFADLVKSINSFYQHSGNVTAQVTVPQQNIKSGNLKVEVIEGKIGDVTINSGKLTDKMQKFTAFGKTQNQTLNINDINQALYQINRLPSNRAVMKIEPAQQVGFSNVIIENNKKFPVSARITHDNLGNNFTGVRRTTFAGNIDNALSLNDQINLKYTTNLNDPDYEKDLQSFVGGISIPYKYYTFSYTHSRSRYLHQNSGMLNPSIVTGYSYRNDAAIDRTLLNNKDYRIATNLSLTEKESASYLNDIKNVSSARRLTIGHLSFSVSRFFKNGTTLYLKPEYVKGLKLLNALQDRPNSVSGTPKAQFDLYKLYATISKKVEVPKINLPVTLASEFEGQFSQDTLYGSEQFSVGGYSSVRGFRENYLDGDHGYYLRNKASFNLGALLKPILNKKDNSSEEEKTTKTAKNKEKNDGNFYEKFSASLNKINIEPFYDYGYTQEKFSGDSGRLSGAGLKAIYGGKYFDASLTYSWALQKSRLISSDVKENKMLYFELSMKCC